MAYRRFLARHLRARDWRAGVGGRSSRRKREEHAVGRHCCFLLFSCSELLTVALTYLSRLEDAVVYGERNGGRDRFSGCCCLESCGLDALIW